MAAELNPNSAKNHAIIALWLPFIGRSQEALEHIQKAWRLNPFPEDWYFDSLGLAYHGAGHYEEALAAWKECARRMPDYLPCPLELTFLSLQMGRENEARAHAREVLRINPRFKLSEWQYGSTPSPTSRSCARPGFPNDRSFPTLG